MSDKLKPYYGVIYLQFGRRLIADFELNGFSLHVELINIYRILDVWYVEGDPGPPLTPPSHHLPFKSFLSSSSSYTSLQYLASVIMYTNSFILLFIFSFVER